MRDGDRCHVRLSSPGPQFAIALQRRAGRGTLVVLLPSQRLRGEVESVGFEDHPRRTIGENLNYVRRHQEQMDYRRYRARGWPIGSGVTESGVKMFNKLVKRTEQFWKEPGAESILALRALWLSQDDRWRHYWLSGELLRQAA